MKERRSNPVCISYLVLLIWCVSACANQSLGRDIEYSDQVNTFAWSPQRLPVFPANRPEPKSMAQFDTKYSSELARWHDASLETLPDNADVRHQGCLVGWFERVRLDHRQFYSMRNGRDVALVMGIGAVMANTNIDRFVTFDLYQENVRNVHTDEWLEVFHEPKFFGEGLVLVPTYASAALLGHWLQEYPLFDTVGDWGSRCFRTFLVGGPPVIVLQQLTGGSRPGEQTYGSDWRPFQDDNGVSGHAFVGAIPFLSAAYMTEQPLLRNTLFVASALPALSRVNDEAHFASQAILGWSLAFVAARAVQGSELQWKHAQLAATTLDGLPQIALQVSY
ncbi:MAG: phosphatase PAP2 family protein [Planctomycetales bacterium]|nr:phosphatase PAP2 family protein [Planctomycetales bacterium]